MKKLQPDTVLKRNNGISIELDSMTNVKVSVNGTSGFYHEHALRILEVFTRPISIKEALTKLQVHGTQDWIDLTATINKLLNAGVLVEQSEIHFTPDKNPDSFGAFPVHVAMLNDRERTESFIQAINETIKPDDVVLDIGTGTGILAVAAARAGAKRVYAIEAGEMADVAQAVFHSNNVADKITLIRDWSTQTELYEKADVLVSEIIGNEPFSERVLQTIKDARKRLLKPNSRFIPSKLKVFGLPVTIPPNIISQKVVTEERVDDWQNWYDVDLSLLRKFINHATIPLFHANSHKAADWIVLDNPIKLCEIELQTFEETTIEDVIIRTTAKQVGLLNGFLIFFELELGSKTLTTSPIISTQSNHWLNPVWYFDNGRTVKPDDEFSISYSYNAKGFRNEVRLIEE